MARYIDNYALKILKKYSGLSTREISERTYITVHTLNKYLHNRYPISKMRMGTLATLAGLFEVSIESLLAAIDEERDEPNHFGSLPYDY